MEKGITAKQENDSLDLQAHIVKSTRANQTLVILLKNALFQLEEQEKALDKATKANTASRKPKQDNRPDSNGSK